MVRQHVVRFIVSVFLVVFLAACGAGLPPREVRLQPAATATPSTTVLPTRTPPVPTRTVVPSATPRPTPTFVPLQPTATLQPLTLQQREAIFDELWTSVRDHYVYEDYGGLDWERIRAEFAPQVAAAASPAAFYDLLRAMIDRLGDNHSRFESPQDVAEEAARFSGELNYGGIGALVRIDEAGGLIIRLVAGGPADVAGLQAGDIILQIEGVPVTDSDAFGPGGPISAVRGEPGSSVLLTIQSPGDRPRPVRVTRRAIPTNAFQQVEARRLAGTRVGLLRIDTFNAESLVERIQADLEQLVQPDGLEGLIIDVRANSGGRVDLLLDTLALFVDGGSIGSQQGRNFRSILLVPEGDTFAPLTGVPVVVLIGPETVSAAEMFAAGLQTLDRARVVGLPSAGNTENMRSYTFLDGSRLWLAELTYRLPDDSLIEGRGVVPDRVVDAEWWRFEPEQDPQIQAALEELNQPAPPAVVTSDA